MKRLTLTPTGQKAVGSTAEEDLDKLRRRVRDLTGPREHELPVVGRSRGGFSVWDRLGSLIR